ncbi:MAG: peptidylprolyl isomerase [Cyanobacteria bacterium SBLK]|nr:peptidylprolyl isomerase [Cyanobacteria bacterium SBLK]
MKSSQTDPVKTSGSTALKIGDLNVSSDEIIPLLEKYQLLPKLVREIIIDRALVSVECSTEELTKAIERFYQQQKVKSPEQLQAWLQQKQSTIEQVQNAIARGIKLEKFKETMWGDRLESYFLERKLEFDKVLYSLLRTQDLGVAQELYFRILEGEAEFPRLAKEYSQGVEAKTGGIVGPISLSKIHPTLKEMFQRSKPGQLWSPQYIDNWFVVVRLEQFVPAKLDEEIRQKLLDERFNQWLQEQYQQVVFQ